MAFFPLTMPLTTGPGTIAAAVALGADRAAAAAGGPALSSLVSVLVAAAVALAILHAYRNAGAMARLFGREGTHAVTRLSAFLLLCVGVQIVLTAHRTRCGRCSRRRTDGPGRPGSSNRTGSLGCTTASSNAAGTA